MDILEQKMPLNYNESIKKIIKLLTFDKNKLSLKGSSSLTSQQYFADYDFYCIIHPNKTDFYEFLEKLINNINETNDLWFIELKLQTKDNKKVRITKNHSINKRVYHDIFTNLDFVKIDLVARIDNIFTEISCVYSFSDNPTKKDIIQSVNDEAEILFKEKQYYKVLKRKFTIAKLNNDKTILKALSNIFNSDLGEEYKLISNIEALDLVLKNYQDEDTINKILINLKDLHLPLDVKEFEKFIKQRKTVLNREAKRYLL